MNEKVWQDLAIETKGLVKRYNEEVLAVDGIDLAIEGNSIYALLGPNGAGKTTTLSMLTTLLEPTAGYAKVCGLDVVKQANDVRNCIGVTFQETVLDDALTGRQALDFHGKLYGQSKAKRQAKVEELLALVELEAAADRKIQTYSGGMKRRLELIRGLMTEPAVLFLDEPTLGLDPQSRARLGDYIRDLKELGYRLIPEEKLIEMKIHDVEPEYIEELIELGYSDISTSRLVEMQIHNVSTRYIRQLAELGYREIRPSKLVEMKIHNVTPRYISQLAELGYKDISPSQLVAMNIHNVTPSYIRKLHKRGIDDLSPRELIEYKIHNR